MLAPQYDKMGISGLDGIAGTELPWEGRGGMNGLSSSRSGPMSMRKESCFSFSAIAVGVGGFLGESDGVGWDGMGEEEEEEEV